MSTISTGVGLASGFPIQEFVDALMAVQRRPLTLLTNRIATLTNRRTALLQISAQILGIQNAATRFGSLDFFQSTRAASTDETSILATASTGAAVGQYTFVVRNLASSHQLISEGFATRDATPVGAGTLTIETADALVNRSTRLGSLNGGAGVKAGKIKVTDRAGQSAEIDLRTTLTIDDVIDAINSQSDAAVAVHIEGDHLVLEDQTGLGTGTLSVAEVGTGKTAANLGLLGSSSSGVLTGSDLVAISADTRLDDLNDGNGIRRLKAQADFSVSLADGTTLKFDLSEYLTLDTPLSVLNNGGGVPSGEIRLTNRAGKEAIVDLSGAATIGDVKAAIEAAGVDFTVALAGGHLLVSDGSTGDEKMKIEEVGGGGTAEALGLLGTSASESMTGDDIYFITTVGDVQRVINDQVNNGGKLVAAISTNGTGLTLIDTTSGAGTFEVTALNDSKSAEDLGILQAASGDTIESRRLTAGLNTVLLKSLNGGSGIGLGQIDLTDRAGATASIDLSNAETLADVIAAINGASTQITATVSSSGLGIELRDTSGQSGNLRIVDVTGSAAADLNIAFEGAADTVSSGNLQRQYVSATTRLADFNGGVQLGKFKITDSMGQSATVDLTQGNEETLQDVIDEINSRGIGVVARINDTGDGLLIEDTAGGDQSLTIKEDGGKTARSLGILGSAEDGETTVDGSLEARITIAGNDTLEDVLDKIKAANAPVGATIINDGISGRPFRLSLTGTQTGYDGALAIDAGGSGLVFETLVKARDATVLFGSADAENPLVLSSSSNTLSDTITGVRLDLIGASEGPVTISVTKDVDAIVADISSFVASFNTAIAGIDSLTSFDPETEVRGVLNGDSTARRVRQGLLGIVNRSAEGLDSSFNRLSQVGISVASGAKLSFDEEKFRSVFESDPAAVEALFTTEETGFGNLIASEIERFTDSETGIIPVQEEAIQASEDLLNDRIDQLEILLERRRERLLSQFQAMEMAISQLQSQQSALSALMTIATSSNTNS
ncbi:MAG: flagellar filament capping protein FliD [Planctomycetota bacterium]